jgi:hypothetical protein
MGARCPGSTWAKPLYSKRASYPTGRAAGWSAKSLGTGRAEAGSPRTMGAAGGGQKRTAGPTSAGDSRRSAVEAAPSLQEASVLAHLLRMRGPEVRMLEVRWHA